MTSSQVVYLDEIRTIGFAATGAGYVPIGPSFAHPVRLICLSNNTDGDMLFSVDGVTDQLFIPAGSFKLFDLSTNRTHVAQYWALQAGTQFYIKRVTVPTKGSVYIECLWGEL